MEKGNQKAAFDSYDCFLIFLLSCISFVIRWWNLYYPDGTVFDEFHFGNFTNWYTKSEFFFDIHPPLAKLIMFYFANLSEYDGNIVFPFVKHYPQEDYIQLRITPSFFSSLCAPLIYLSLRFTHVSHLSSFTSSLLIIFDTSTATEGRFILSDGILHFFCCLHIAVLSYSSSLKRGKRFNVFHILNGLSLGCACSCKNTAWGLMGLDAYVYIVYFIPVLKLGIFDYLFEIFIYGVSLFLIQFSVYCLSFYAHFILLPFSGQGNKYVTNNLRSNLISLSSLGTELWGKRIVGSGLFYRSMELTHVMHKKNMHVVMFHPSQSRPFNWPLLTGMSVLFWGHFGSYQVKCQGNIVSYYLAFIGVVGIILFGFRKNNFFIILRFVVGWAACYFPLYLVPRVLYLYHYLIPLIFGVMSYGALLDFVHPKIKGIIACISCACVIFVFWLWSPYVYGATMRENELMTWNRNWLYGDKAFQKAKENPFGRLRK